MEAIRKFLKQNLQLVLLALCGILVVSGILVIVFGGGGAVGWLKAMFIIFGIVLVLLGCSLLFYSAIVSTAEKANFFLYNNQTKSNISLDELDFERVNKKMTFIMANLLPSAAKVWTENVFKSRTEILEDDGFVPLIAYKILYDLADRANESIWNLYLLADGSIIDSIVSGLEMNEDSELGKAFKFLHDNAGGSYERTEKFLADNKKYIQNKMLKYVKNNINKF